jgi:hypothetical protein
VFYEPASKGYKIVEPPPGLLIMSLPKGAVAVTVNNVKYPEVASCYPNNTIFLYMLLRKMAGNVTCTLPSANHPY